MNNFGGFDFSMFENGDGRDAAPADNSKADLEIAENRRKVKVFETMSTHQKLRLLSESALDEVFPWHLEKGKAYHVASYGDVDALTYLRRVAQDQQLDYVILTTWCMAQVDADEMDKWVERGLIKRVDYVIGEVFQTHARYKKIRETLAKTTERCGGRVLRCRTHMKVMVCYGQEYDCVIESSANVDTNPRAEQTCITVDTGLADWYKEWFDDLPNFDTTPEGWEPWQRTEEKNI